MHSKRSISVVTSTRADYGLLFPLLNLIKNSNEFDLYLVVTGTHLSKKFGFTIDQIIADGFTVHESIPILSENIDLNIAEVVSNATSGLSNYFKNFNPDLLLILGDRYEILVTAIVASFFKVPIAHLCGGDITQGALDDSYRHSITKMSHLHFVTNSCSENRVQQLGETPEHVFNVGSTALDMIQLTPLLSKPDLEKKIGFKFKDKNLLITFHPPTLNDDPLDQLNELLAALDTIDKNTGLIFTASNADPLGEKINQRIQSYVSKKSNSVFVASLGQQKYYSTMNIVDAIVGNSSSGLYEAPSFKIPTLNIGDRQKGRLQSESVINCLPQMKSIMEGIQNAYQLDCSKAINPYGEGKASEKILKTLSQMRDFKKLVNKSFYDFTSKTTA